MPSNRTFDIERFSVDGACRRYDGTDGSKNRRLWEFISQASRSRGDCRAFLKTIGVDRNVSQRASTMLNWLQTRRYIKASSTLAANAAEPPSKGIGDPAGPKALPIPRLDDNSIDATRFGELLAQKGHIAVGPALEPKDFVERHLRGNPSHKEGAILIAARSTGKADWSQVRDVIHKDFRRLCDCRASAGRGS